MTNGFLALVIDNFFRMDLRGQGYGVHCHFQQYLSYIVQISVIGGGGNRIIRRKLPYDHEFNWKQLKRNKCISYPRCTDDFRKSDRWVNASATGLLVSEGIINLVVIVSALTWFIRYIYV